MNAPAHPSNIRPLTRNVVSGDDPNLRQRTKVMPCPHCHGPSSVRDSRMVSPTYKDLYCMCLNPDCGFTWKAHLAIDYTLSPSAIPNPDVDIPMAPSTLVRRTYFPAPDGYDPRQMAMFDSDPDPPG